jgi:drug/metabolite transporter (DMT)-like permease
MMRGMRDPARDAAAPPSLGTTSRTDLGLIGLGVSAVSTSGPLIAAAAAPALAIGFWRNAMAAAVIAPWAIARNRGELRSMVRREWLLALLAGVLLAAHFATWVPSLRFTTVASSTAMLCAQPVWTALIARAGGEHIARRAWIGMGIAVVGALLLTGVDFSVEPRALVGDLLALLGGAFASAYTVAGSKVRRTVSTTSLTLVCYSTCTLLLLVVCLVGGLPLGGYDGSTWLKLVALTAGAQLLGHSVFNHVLRTSSPTVVALGLLFEVPGATLVAALFLGQVPPLAIFPAAALLLAGIVVVISSRAPADEAAAPVD